VQDQVLENTPTHVAIIMDGNGRWAKSRFLPRSAGHKKGMETVRSVVRAAGELGIRYLTLFGFSSENWKRPQSEISDLMGLLRIYLQREAKSLHEQNVRLRIIGDRTKLAKDIQDKLVEVEALTEKNTGLTLCIALSYGSRNEIVLAAQKIAEKLQAGVITSEEITEEAFSAALFTHDVPDPDVLIRTSGEQRISNFLLWQIAYTELVFVDTLWPDFTKTDLIHALREFGQRERRYGAISA